MNHFRSLALTALFMGAMAAGTLMGAYVPDAGEFLAGVVDPSIWLLVCAIFYTVEWKGLKSMRRSTRTILLAVGVNFLVVPVVAFGVVHLVPDAALRVGVLLYCLAPCTDWFLGFTRVAGGDDVASTALVPVQMILQLILFPVWLTLFAHVPEQSPHTFDGTALLEWFFVPAALGAGLRLLSHVLLPRPVQRRILYGVDRAVPWIIASVIVTIFASNITVVLAQLSGFAWVLLAAFVFFVVMFMVSGAAGRLFRLVSGGQVSLAITTAARNAPTMLALSMVAFPQEPMIHVAIIAGMLIEFPHLTALVQIFRSRDERRVGRAGKVLELAS